MKKLVKFLPACAALLGLVALVLLMACHGLVHKDNSGTWFSGLALVFGGGKISALGFETDFGGSLAWTALLAWIFELVGVLLSCCLALAGLLKAKLDKKLLSLLTLIALGLLVVGGVLTFFSKGAFGAANDLNLDGYGLTFGFILSAILALLAGGALGLKVVLEK